MGQTSLMSAQPDAPAENQMEAIKWVKPLFSQLGHSTFPKCVARL